jgi:preprotein translocase subunit SecA
VSLDDDLIKIFGGENIRRWVDYLALEKDAPLESELLTKTLENAQKKVELYNYDLRKNIFQYDEILNNQRKQLFQARNELLGENLFNEIILRYGESLLDEEWEKEKNKYFCLEKASKLEKLFNSYFVHLKKPSRLEKKFLYKEIWISLDMRYAESNFYHIGFLKKNRFTLLLSILDFYWTEHLERMNYIRETINWKAYGQQNPLVEYNMEAFQSFHLMFEQIRSSMVYYSLNNPIY